MSPRWHLSHTRGYIELGMLTEAANELKLVVGSDRETSEFLEVSAALFQERKDWLQLEIAARELTTRHPENPGWWIMYAYGARRTRSLECAEAILKEAEKQHPGEATIQFNLGCYACQKGELDLAQAYVDNAIRLNSQFEAAAQNDPDLEPLRARKSL